MIDDIDFNVEDEKLKVIYILPVGVDSEGKNIYNFLCTGDIDNVWMEEWGEKPACNCRFLQPNEGDYEKVYELKTDILFTLGQDSCCCSYQDVCDGCLAIAYENIDSYEEYPPLRLIFYYGQEIDEIKCELAKRDLILTEL